MFKWKRKDLRSYQIGASDFIKEMKRCALFIEPGLGKTAATLTAFLDLIDDFKVHRVLVIAPPKVARQTWSDEIKDWHHLNELSWVHIAGTPNKRRELINRKCCFHFISIELVHWLVDELKQNHGFKVPYDAIVIDESTKIKARNTRRWAYIDEIAFKVKYFVELTGTPAPDKLIGLWPQIYFIDQGQRLGKNITAYRDRWFKVKNSGKGYVPKGHAREEIENRISDIVFTLREADYAKLPERMYNYIYLDMDEPTKQKYKKFEKSYVLELPDNIGEMKTTDGAALRTKLRQLANGIVYQDKRGLDEKIQHAYHSLKLDALEDLYEELNGSPLLVAYHFKSDLQRIKQKFPEAVVFSDRRDIQDRWNEGRIPMLLAHPQSVAHGLNLQFGGHTICWYSLTDSLENYIQFNKRLHRSGQKHPVMIHHLLTRGSIDEAILKALQENNDVQEMFMNSLKKLIKQYKD